MKWQKNNAEISRNCRMQVIFVLAEDNVAVLRKNRKLPEIFLDQKMSALDREQPFLMKCVNY